MRLLFTIFLFLTSFQGNLLGQAEFSSESTLRLTPLLFGPSVNVSIEVPISGFSQQEGGLSSSASTEVSGMSPITNLTSGQTISIFALASGEAADGFSSGLAFNDAVVSFESTAPPGVGSTAQLQIDYDLFVDSSGSTAESLASLDGLLEGNSILSESLQSSTNNGGPLRLSDSFVVTLNLLGGNLATFDFSTVASGSATTAVPEPSSSFALILLLSCYTLRRLR